MLLNQIRKGKEETCSFFCIRFSVSPIKGERIIQNGPINFFSGNCVCQLISNEPRGRAHPAVAPRCFYPAHSTLASRAAAAALWNKPTINCRRIVKGPRTSPLCFYLLFHQRHGRGAKGSDFYRVSSVGRLLICRPSGLITSRYTVANLDVLRALLPCRRPLRSRSFLALDSLVFFFYTIPPAARNNPSYIKSC